MRARFLLAAILLLLAACGGGIASAQSERASVAAESSTVSATAAAFTQADLATAIDQTRSAPSYRYEYYQELFITGRAVVGSLEVPVVRGDVAAPANSLTAEMGVALDFGEDTNSRMNLVSTPDQVCLNVPFYARVLEERVDDEFLWIEPLVEGWGCVDSGRLADDAAVYAALGIGNVNQFVGVLDPIGDGAVLSSKAEMYRGEPVVWVEVLVPIERLLERLTLAPGDGPGEDIADVPPIPAQLRIDSRGRVVSARYGFSHAGQQIAERIEIFDFDQVEPIELPVDVVDVTEPMLALLGQDSN